VGREILEVAAAYKAEIINIAKLQKDQFVNIVKNHESTQPNINSIVK
jgi:hypothetical protein